MNERLFWPTYGLKGDLPDRLTPRHSRRVRDCSAKGVLGWRQGRVPTLDDLGIRNPQPVNNVLRTFICDARHHKWGLLPEVAFALLYLLPTHTDRSRR